MADLNRLAARIVKESTDPSPPEADAQITGRAGGRKGGKARAAKMTPTERSESARKAAEARWARTRQG